MSYSHNDIEVYFYEGMTYQDLGLDPDFNDVDYPDNYKDSKKTSQNQKRKIKNYELIKIVTKEISNCKNNNDIKKTIIKKLIIMGIDTSIYYYALHEFLPEKYVYLAKEKNCLEILIKSVLKSHLYYSLTENMINEINYLLYVIYNNVEKDIVYERVKKIQKFIHEKANAKYGKDGYLKLSPKVMRKLLSTSRLHLNIFDVKELEPDALISIIEKTSSSKHFEPIVNFNYSLLRTIGKIEKLDLNEPLPVFRENILFIFDSYFK